MSRKRKFKVWDIANNEMIKGDFTIVGENGFVFISDESKSRDHVILLEYIGMEDKTETEICEGDILECWDNGGNVQRGVIEYTAPCYSLKIPGKLLYDGGAVKRWENDLFLDMWGNAENTEIKGNIYENKELLNATKVQNK